MKTGCRPGGPCGSRTGHQRARGGLPGIQPGSDRRRSTGLRVCGSLEGGSPHGADPCGPAEPLPFPVFGKPLSPSFTAQAHSEAGRAASGGGRQRAPHHPTHLCCLSPPEAQCPRPGAFSHPHPLTVREARGFWPGGGRRHGDKCPSSKGTRASVSSCRQKLSVSMLHITYSSVSIFSINTCAAGVGEKASEREHVIYVPYLETPACLD